VKRLVRSSFASFGQSFTTVADKFEYDRSNVVFGSLISSICTGEGG